jgi:hypothetical protein
MKKTECGIVEIRECDLRKEYPPVQASVTLSILTLQLVAIEYRQRLIREVWKHTILGGASSLWRRSWAPLPTSTL